MKDGDKIVGPQPPRSQSSSLTPLSQQIIDATSNTIDVLVSPEELSTRHAQWEKTEKREYKYKRGVLFRYARDVADASQGAYTD